jgi:hypothetical protein
MIAEIVIQIDKTMLESVLKSRIKRFNWAIKHEEEYCLK